MDSILILVTTTQITIHKLSFTVYTHAICILAISRYALICFQFLFQNESETYLQVPEYACSIRVRFIYFSLYFNALIYFYSINYR